jgi:CO/xanthine dehydrogenase FAD-binding subunit
MVTDVHISVGPSGPIPSRMLKSEKVLIGFPPSLQNRAAVLQALLEEANFRTSPHRATEAYRRHLAGVLLDEALAVAWQRAHRNLPA